MKMHPKPMLRHNRHVEPVAYNVVYDDKTPEPMHIVFQFENGATQRVVMTRGEAVDLANKMLAVIRVSSR